MIASVAKKPLITEHRVDASTGKVTLFMSNLEEGVAESVQLEIQHINESVSGAVIAFQHDASFGQITIEGTNIADVALSACKLMTRRVQVFGEGSDEKPVKYASFDATQSVLKNLHGFAQREKATHAATAIDKLLSTVEQIYRS